MDDTRIETPEELAARLIGDGDSATQIAMRNIAAEVIRARDAGVAAWCERKAAAAQREADTHESQLDDGTIAGKPWHGKRERMRTCEGQAVAFRGVARTLVSQ